MVVRYLLEVNPMEQPSQSLFQLVLNHLERKQEVHKIWVSDDDSAIRIILEESLTSSGFEVKTFASGDDVVNELKNDKPDLVLTDVQMPGMLGYDLLKHINDNYEDIPVIIMTAFTDMQAALILMVVAFEYMPNLLILMMLYKL